MFTFIETYNSLEKLNRPKVPNQSKRGLFEGIFSFNSPDRGPRRRASDFNPIYFELPCTDVTEDFSPLKHSAFADFIEEFARSWDISPRALIDGWYEPTRKLNTVELIEIKEIVPFNLTKADIGEHLFEYFTLVSPYKTNIIPFNDEHVFSLYLQFKYDILEQDKSKRYSIKAWIEADQDGNISDIPVCDFNGADEPTLSSIPALENTINNIKKIKRQVSEIDSYVDFRFEAPEYSMRVSADWEDMKTPEGDSVYTRVFCKIVLDLNNITEATPLYRCSAYLVEPRAKGQGYNTLVGFKTHSAGLVKFENVERQLLDKALKAGYSF